MGYKVILSTLALEDLEQIVAFVAQNDPAAAERLGHRLLDQAETSVISLTAAAMYGSGPV
jgi:plasmid stabilization system protein ParE